MDRDAVDSDRTALISVGIEILPSLIREVRERMLQEGLVKTLPEINSGLCEDFALDVASLFSERTGLPQDTLTDFEVVNFIKIDPVTGFAYDAGGPFDRELLAEHWPGVRPPDGLDWDDLDRLSADAGFSAGTHVFMFAEGRFYDAEAPEGVESFFDLPFFMRVVESWQAREGAPSGP